ncbi:Uncharacterised protein [Mycobacteroides abscessus subsp. abscessus]|uniref:hypothetical protein n=1 Tax=Mycobacteroides abscessus TaxID=36809 RepID=UPI00092AFF12|nr:hypothetical protein [Mycobacteroides abscessus]SHU66070.1 Uncharacterised protein [Mycobacteroides abscessus subsp. abscessus]
MAAIFITNIRIGQVVTARRHNCAYLGVAVGHGWDSWFQAPTVRLKIASSPTSWFTREFRASELVHVCT